MFAWQMLMKLKTTTGFSIGGVAPIAHIKKLDILIDKSLSRFQYVFGCSGTSKLCI